MFASYKMGLAVPVRNVFSGYPMVGADPVGSVNVGSIRAEIARIRKEWPSDQQEYTAGSAVKVLKDTLGLMDYVLSAMAEAMRDGVIKFNSAATEALDNNARDLERIRRARIEPYIPLVKGVAPAVRVKLPGFRADMLFVYEDIVRKIDALDFIKSITPQWLKILSLSKVLEILAGVGGVALKIKDLAKGAWGGFKWILYVLLAIGGLALGVFLFRGRGSTVIVN